MDSIIKFKTEIQASPDKAKSLKNNIGVLLICKPVLYDAKIKSSYKYTGNNLFFETRYFLGATMESLQSISYNRKYINVEIAGVWVYDIRSGVILDKT